MTYDLGKIVSKIKEDFGTAAVAGDVPDPQDYISTGNKAVDLMCGGRGIPFGYIVEWAGLSGSGKTLMLQQMLAIAQREYNAIGIWVDRENSFFNARAEELGINVEQMLIVKPSDVPTVQYAEKFLSTTFENIRNKYPEAFVFCCIDSLSAFDSGQEGEEMGRKAKALHSLFRKLTSYLGPKMAMHFSNQVTFKPGIMFGDPRTTTGGEAPKYYSTFRIFLDDVKPITSGDEIIGNWIKVDLKKTRLGPADRKVYIPFYYREGISELGGYARMLVNRGILEAKNKTEFKAFKQSTVKYDDIQYNEFRPEKFLDKHPELLLNTWPGDGIRNDTETETIEEDS